MAKANVECQFCGKVNRVDLARFNDRPKCGDPDCGKPILLDRPVKVTEANFDKVVGGAEVPVLVDFYADWCGPCRMVAPVLDDLARSRAGDLLIAKVDTDRAPGLSQRFNIRGIPYFARFDGGKKTKELVGADPEKLRQLAS